MVRKLVKETENERGRGRERESTQMRNNWGSHDLTQICWVKSKPLDPKRGGWRQPGC